MSPLFVLVFSDLKKYDRNFLAIVRANFLIATARFHVSLGKSLFSIMKNKETNTRSVNHFNIHCKHKFNAFCLRIDINFFYQCRIKSQRKSMVIKDLNF